MHPHRDLWLWAGAAMTALALACVAVAGGLLAARTNYPFWSSAPMIIAYVCGGLAVVCFAAAIREVPFPFGRTAPVLTQTRQEPSTEERQRTESPAATTPPPLLPQPIFDEAPPELADMSPASLTALLAGRTNAQIHKLMEQHRGKPVRVSGEVEHVQFGTSAPSVRLKTTIPFLLFFDAEGYDAESVLLTLNKGDKIVASGQIHSFEQSTFMEFVAVIVALEKCRLVEARRVS